MTKVCSSKMHFSNHFLYVSIVEKDLKDVSVRLSEKNRNVVKI